MILDEGDFSSEYTDVFQDVGVSSQVHPDGKNRYHEWRKGRNARSKLWQRALNVEERTKLLLFLARNPESLRALFLDSQHACPAEWSSISALLADSTGSFLYASFQIPLIFNIASLARHVEQLDLESLL
jgi:hypothetical protein